MEASPGLAQKDRPGLALESKGVNDGLADLSGAVPQQRDPDKQSYSLKKNG